MTRIFYRPPLFLRYALALFLVTWTIVFALLLAFTGPPIPMIILLILPIPLMAWVLSLSHQGTTWEANQIGLIRTTGRGVHAIHWGEVDSIEATGDESRGIALLRITSKDGTQGMSLVSGPGLGFGDVRALYETSSYHLRHSEVKCGNAFGWEPRLSSVPEKEARGEPERIAPHVSMSLLTSGLIIVVTGGYRGQTVSAAFGGALVVMGIGLYLAGNFLKRPR